MPHRASFPASASHLLSQASHQAGVPTERHHVTSLEPAEIPQRRARDLMQLSEFTLASLPEAERQQPQPAWGNELVALLHQ